MKTQTQKDNLEKSVRFIMTFQINLKSDKSVVDVIKHDRFKRDIDYQTGNVRETEIDMNSVAKAVVFQNFNQGFWQMSTEENGWRTSYPLDSIGSVNHKIELDPDAIPGEDADGTVGETE